MLLPLTLFSPSVCFFLSLLYFFLGFVTYIYIIHTYLHLFSLLWKHVLLNCFKWLPCHGLFRNFEKLFKSIVVWCAHRIRVKEEIETNENETERKIHWMVGLLLGMFRTIQSCCDACFTLYNFRTIDNALNGRFSRNSHQIRYAACTIQ